MQDNKALLTRVDTLEKLVAEQEQQQPVEVRQVRMDQPIRRVTAIANQKSRTSYLLTQMMRLGLCG